MGLDLRLWQRNAIAEDEGENGHYKTVEKEVCEKSNADSRGYEKGMRAPMKAPGWFGGRHERRRRNGNTQLIFCVLPDRDLLSNTLLNSKSRVKRRIIILTSLCPKVALCPDSANSVTLIRGEGQSSTSVRISIVLSSAQNP